MYEDGSNILVQCKPTAFCGKCRCVASFVRIGCELIGKRIDEIEFLQIHTSTYSTAFICILDMYL
jgi:hypothetical protein